MLGVLEGFAIILMVIFIGYLLARFRVITSDDQRLVLNRVAFYAATPALIFMVVSQSSRDALFSPVILVEALTALVTSGIFVAVSQKFFPTDRASTVMGAAATAYVNSNNIGHVCVRKRRLCGPATGGANDDLHPPRIGTN